MEYREEAKSWKRILEVGDVDGALRTIEGQIAQNLMDVHNHFCERKLQTPLDVYAYGMYGSTENEESKKMMQVFVDINYDFIEIGHGLDSGSTYPKEQVMRDFEELEDKLRQEMSKI